MRIYVHTRTSTTCCTRNDAVDDRNVKVFDASPCGVKQSYSRQAAEANQLFPPVIRLTATGHNY